MVTVLWENGFRVIIFTDDHEPAHVHIIRGDGDAKINLVPEVHLVWSRGMKRREAREALRIATENQQLLLEPFMATRNHSVSRLASRSTRKGAQVDVVHRPSGLTKWAAVQTETRRAGPVWAKSFGLRLARATSPNRAEPLGPVPNLLRQNASV